MRHVNDVGITSQAMEDQVIKTRMRRPEVRDAVVSVGDLRAAEHAGSRCWQSNSWHGLQHDEVWPMDMFDEIP